MNPFSTELGMNGMMQPLKGTSKNHEGNGLALVQQWDEKKWTIVSDWIPALPRARRWAPPR